MSERFAHTTFFFEKQKFYPYVRNLLCFVFQLLQSLEDSNGEKDEKDVEKAENMNKENKLNVPLGIKTSSLKNKSLLSPFFFHFKRVKKSRVERKAQNERSISFLFLFINLFNIK